MTILIPNKIFGTNRRPVRPDQSSYTFSSYAGQGRILVSADYSEEVMKLRKIRPVAGKHKGKEAALQVDIALSS